MPTIGKLVGANTTAAGAEPLSAIGERSLEPVEG